MTSIYQPNQKTDTGSSYTSRVERISAALSELKTELDREGLLRKGDTRDRISQIENFLAFVQQESRQTVVAGNQKPFLIQRQQLSAIADKMRSSSDAETLLNIVVNDVREILQSDRTFIYRFENSNSGTVIAESMKRGWTPALNESLPVLTFGLDKAEDYIQQKVMAIAETAKADLTAYQKQLLERFQVKACLSLPILVSGKIWGLLVIQECVDPRQWEEAEISLLTQISTELTVTLQGFEFSIQLQKQIDGDRAVAKVIERIRQKLDQDSIFKVLTQEIRYLLKADRVGVYKFNPDWSGEFIVESVTGNWTKLVGPNIKTVWADTHLQETQGGRYRHHESFIVNNIYTVGHSPCHVEILEQFEVKAYAIVPIFVGEKLWGLLGVYQNSAPREWQQYEINWLNEIAASVWVALNQAENMQQLQGQSEKLAKTAERDRTVTKVLERILQSLDLDTLFKTTTKEVRQLMGVERVSIYKFRPDYFGDFIAESEAPGQPKLLVDDKTTAWEDPYLAEFKGGRFRNNQNLVVDDIYAANLTPCHVEALERFNIRSCLVVPIFKGQELWGLMSAFQNSGPHHWEKYEIDLLTQMGVQIGLAAQQAEYLQEIQAKSAQVEEAAQRERALARVIDTIRQSLDLKTVFNNTTKEVRQLMGVERIAIYKFRPDYFGDFIAEAEAPGQPKLVGPDRLRAWEDPYLYEHKGGRFRNNEILAVDDVRTGNLTPCHLEALESFNIRACLVVPIFKGKLLWGLLSAFENTKTRQWQQYEIDLLTQIGSQIGVAVQQSEYLQQIEEKSAQLAEAAERDRAVTKVIERIRQSLDIQTLFKTTTKEVRQLIKVERVSIYKFRSDYFGDFVAESEAPGQPKLVIDDRTVGWEDPYLNEHKGGRFRKNEVLVVNDVYNGGLTDCHVEALERFNVKACVVVPIFKGKELWGLLSAFENTKPRHWQQYEVDLLFEIGAQLGVALQQAEYLEQLQAQSAELAERAERDRAITKVIERIRQSLDIDTIFKITTKEVRQLINADRVTIYKFRPDYFGDFVAESEAYGQPKLVVEDRTTAWEDPYLNEHQGGRFLNNEVLVVDDVYNGGLTECHVEALERFNVKACVVVAIFKGQELWGLLSAFQNTATRHWEQYEVDLLLQVAAQIGVAVQQTEYLKQLEQQSQQLAQAAERDKAAKEQLQQRALQLLIAVRPALEGDLTVRAPITEDEVGTIADAYNNTLQALRKIVMQVQTTAQQVAQTSISSDSSIVGLSTQAQEQFQELNKALEQIQEMVKFSQAVANNAQQVEVAVQQANQTVQSGDTAMNRTVEGILEIRETVSQTAKKIKQLSESSQKISKVVQLIGNFATQTNVLALNAAIEATRAGEFGRGFAVVAEEVRSLSRQSAAATTEIEKLVQEIQVGTGEVTEAMETGIQQVVQGTNLVNETRQSLNAIAAATNQISQLVDKISQATQIQTQQSVAVTQTMTDVAGIANKTSEDSILISEKFKELLTTAQELQATASRFKVN